MVRFSCEVSKRSFVHRYFQTVAAGNKVRCSECAIMETITTGITSIMKTHLAFEHPQLYEKILKDGTSVKQPKVEQVNIFSKIRAVKLGLNGCCSFLSLQSRKLNIVIARIFKAKCPYAVYGTSPAHERHDLHWPAIHRARKKTIVILCYLLPVC